VDDSGHPCLFLFKEEKKLAFTIECDVNCDFVIYGNYTEVQPFYPNLLFLS
jgi:hypothetical protein